MTTVAASLTEMAADSRVTLEATTYPARKLAVVGQAIVGVAGTNSWISAFVAWFRKGAKGAPPKTEADEDGEALILRVDGLYVCDGSMIMDRLERPYHAIGSGAQCALAMLSIGKSPTEAVEKACEIDPSTGGPVQTLGLAAIPSAAPRRKRSAR